MANKTLLFHRLRLPEFVISAVKICVLRITDLILRQDLYYENVQESLAYPVIPLLCDLGGALGLMLGASLLTFFEIVEAVVLYAHSLYQCKQKQVRHFRPSAKHLSVVCTPELIFAPRVREKPQRVFQNPVKKCGKLTGLFLNRTCHAEPITLPIFSKQIYWKCGLSSSYPSDSCSDAPSPFVCSSRCRCRCLSAGQDWRLMRVCFEAVSTDQILLCCAGL